MADFLTALSKKVKRNSTALENYQRIFVLPGIPFKRQNNEPLRVNILFKHIQMLPQGHKKRQEHREMDDTGTNFTQLRDIDEDPTDCIDFNDEIEYDMPIDIQYLNSQLEESSMMNLKDPNMSQMKGRKRIRSGIEEASKQTNICGHCKKRGHNKRTYK